jgi:hypothetical protein
VRVDRFISLVLVTLLACGGYAFAAADPMSAKRKMIEQITSIFENSTPAFQYGYAERLKDSYFRGITFGRVGFVSCMDGLELLENYESSHPNSPLTPFLKIMKDFQAGKMTCSQNADLLEDAEPSFGKVMRKMARRQDFRDLQDALEDRLYYSPSIALGLKIGLKLPWSYLNLYDTYIQHGLDGADDIAEDTTKFFGGKTPATGLDEIQWTTKFVALRRHVLETGDPEWKDSVGRVDALLKIHTRDHNDALDPFFFNAGHYGLYILPAFTFGTNAAAE